MHAPDRTGQRRCPLAACEADPVEIVGDVQLPEPLIGRTDELAALAAFVGEQPRPAASFVLQGEAGIGKTTLWREGLALAEAAGYRVLSCRPARPEVQLSFAALGDLLEPVLGEAGRLPPPQRRALQIALLQADGRGSH